MTPREERRALRRALRALGATPPPRRAGWETAPGPGLCLPRLLPGALPSHPPVSIGFGDTPSRRRLGAILGTIRERTLWWPAVRADAAAPETLLDLAEAADPAALVAAATDGAVALTGGREAARRAAADAGLATADSAAWISPRRLRRVIGPAGGAATHWAALGGIEAEAGGAPADPLRWLARARWLDPWRGEETAAAEALAALAVLREAAERNDRPVVTLGLSNWKRRNAAPFLEGPCGPATHRARAGPAARAAARRGARLAIWGARAAPPEAEGLETLRLEDGFVRSVGLGLRHAPPASLAVDSLALYFDATRETDFERLAREAAFPPALLARAGALRRRLVALRITKYNVGGAAALPETRRRRLLVPGQVEGDASLRFGSPAIRSNAELLRAARARNPDAFLLYKPHPDVLTGLREGAVDAATLAEAADAVAPDASAEACLDWADGVETMTSLMGFEALLRGKPVAVHGRPFYHGWGLTAAAGDPFDRGRRLSLDALAAAALILYPRYVDPCTRLPATPERVLDWLHEERAFVRTRRGRLREGWRHMVSRMLNVVR